MRKYDPLGSYLKSKHLEQVPMTFAEIEKLIDDRLPASARRHRAWWSNNPSNSVITKVWLEAGYVTANVDLATERLTFRRNRPPVLPASPRPPRRAGRLYGCMKGTLTVVEGADLTMPADPDWAEVYADG
ncbi:DUF7662 domain-containing protein [Stappia indica]|uniref:DUF7662 domain-containing protein n=1 Tax=Stappia indica TaxID=538381 RepID=A0A857C993_9HYPH|nr:hypothetical protein [Stappia indica]QGZ35438.1 hypothetical protein GH266_13615 [Stappia indica]